MLINAVEGVQLLGIAGRGIRDLAQSAVHRGCAQTLARRDAWLRIIPDDCPRDVKVRLRLSDMNGPRLFDNDLLDQAKEAIQQVRTDLVHSEVLEVHADDQLSFSEGGEGQEMPLSQSSMEDRWQDTQPREKGSMDLEHLLDDDQQARRPRFSRRRRRKRGQRRNGKQKFQV